MAHQFILYLAFLSQILIISYFIPRSLIRRMQYVLEHYSESEYPKLYPLSREAIKMVITGFTFANHFVLSAGLIIWIVSAANQSIELLNWDSQMVLTLYFFLQALPYLALAWFSYMYMKLMREAHKVTKRTADLQPRKITDYVSASLLSLSAITFVACIILVLWIQQSPFPGFGGFWNIIFIVSANAWFFILAMQLIYGKKTDPHQTSQGRFEQSNVAIKQMVLVSIVVNVFLLLNLSLAWLELRHIGDIVLSVYFQFIVVLGTKTISINDIDFSVYRKDPVTV